MLQPKHYPEMLGKALVLDADPFITMVEDDNPWAEGLFLVVLMGVLIGIAKIVGILFTTSIMPDAAALQAALLQISDYVSNLLFSSASGRALSDSFRTYWDTTSLLYGYRWSWLQAGWLLLAPFVLVIQWLVYGLITHFIARALGGEGQLQQTLGAVALLVAPQIFVLLRVIPFVSVSLLLIWVWSILIVYRATEVTHGLGWRKSAAVTVATPALLALLALAIPAGIGIATALFGGIA